ncbi:hypothetical protein [Methanobrevibacter millerae]|uniref:Uncharacterized protein n=1 Tax=Methanobrevibacter millerae TaxID=230361 RepID=A0A1G5WCN0_9EURY|nr:hypothetical protein [Methanobrevibacter millerae]SDA55506.1 hypothetical protein SAMN02910315_01292 [Methanobrevibacter millerae]
MGSELKQFIGLIVFGNIENLILAAQGVGAGVNPVGLACLSFIAVFCWLLIGTMGTKAAIKYARHINFIGGLAIFILGLQAMIQSIPGIMSFFH